MFLLPALALVVAGLAALGGAAALAPRAGLQLATVLFCTAGAMLAGAGLLGGAEPAALAIPAGPPGLGLTLALDGLSGLFLLLLFLCATAAAASLPPRPAPAAPLFPVLVAALALTLLAADGFTLVLGLAGAAFSAWALTASQEGAARRPALRGFGMAGLAALALTVGLAAIAPAGPDGVPDLGFAAIRSASPEAWPAAAALGLTLLGAGALAGLAPLHAWLPPAHAEAPGAVAALLAGPAVQIALYALIRVVFDLLGPVSPAGWGVSLLVLGGAYAMLGGRRACLEPALKPALGGLTLANAGLVVAALGVALIARGADLPALTSLALGAALLHALAAGLGQTLLLLGAEAIQRATDTRMLHRMGGLIHRMPVTAAAMLAGAAGAAALPPGLGFAADWLLLQALMTAPHAGGMATQFAMAVLVGVIGLAVALMAAALVRVVGVALLGRPRTPRGAAAEEAAPAARCALAGLAVLVVLAGLLPGPLLHLAGPALGQLHADTLDDRAGLLLLAAQAGGTAYSAPAIALLLVLAAVAVAGLVRALAPPGQRRGPAWDGGFAAAPPWLPFGDPATQYGPASFSQGIRRLFGARLSLPWPVAPRAVAVRLDRLQRLATPQTLAMIFAVLVALLAALALVQAR